MKKEAKRLLSITLALAMALSLFGVISVSAAENKVKVIIKNENFPVSDGAAWDGVLIDAWVELNDNDSMESVLERTVTEKGYSLTISQYNYISSVNGLSEFDNKGSGGWMMTLNDWFPLNAASYYTVKDGLLSAGDEIVMMYSNNWGADCGSLYGDLTTILNAVAFEGATLSEAFSPSQAEYTLEINSTSDEIRVYPEAYNKNYQARIYKNEFVPETDGADICRGSAFEVANGDTVYVGVGYPNWPSMNSFSGEAVGTVYKFTVKYVPLLGDLNGNGRLDILDVTVLQQYLAEFIDLSDTQASVADYNGDGEIDIKDATAMQMTLAEMD